MTNKPNQVNAVDRIDVHDDVIHFIHQYPAMVPASEIRESSRLPKADYHWEDHMDINPTTGEVSVDALPNMEFRPENGQYFSFPMVVAASDGLNLTYQDVEFRVIHKPEAPVIGNMSLTIRRREGESVDITLSAHDPEHGSLVYTSSNLPSGFTLSAAGRLRGTAPANPTAIDLSIPFTVNVLSTATGLGTSFQMVLQVENINQAPYLESTYFGVSDANFSITLVGRDRETDTPVTFSLISGLGTLSGNVLSGSLQSGSRAFVIRVSSGTGNRAKHADYTVTVERLQNLPPVWRTNSGSIGNSSTGSAFSFTFLATDPDGATVTYHAQGSLPAGLSLNSNTGVLSGTPTAAGNHTFVIIARDTANSDGPQNSVPRTFTLNVVNSNQPPVWSTNAGLVLNLYPYQPVDFQFVANDPEGSVVTYSITKPATLNWLQMSNSGRMTGTVPFGFITTSDITFTVTASDGVHQVSREFSLRVNDVTPVTRQFTSTTEFTVPNGIYQMMILWACGGGGGGGCGQERGHGGGGGGGGSGSYLRYLPMRCAPGDLIRFEVGAGGAGGIGGTNLAAITDGGNGGETRVIRNGQIHCAAYGGGGGKTSTNVNKGYITSPGGHGGIIAAASSSVTPDTVLATGIAGGVGMAGGNDKASSSGAAGGRGHLLGCAGGAGGIAGASSTWPNGPVAGSNGVYYGSGGGGGGSKDRVSRTPIYWNGGAGVSGFLEVTYPSQGPVGGHEPWSAPAGGGGGTPPVGGGGGGGGCCWDEAVMPSGKRIADVAVGDPIVLMNDDGEGYHNATVEGIRPSMEHCYTLITESGIRLTCSDSTPIIVKGVNGPKGVRLDPTALLMEMVPVLDNGEYRWEYITDIVDAGILPVRIMSANNGVYAAGNAAGRYIFTHNMALDGEQKVLV